MNYSIIKAMEHPDLFQPLFPEESWWSWKAWLSALYGLPMDDQQLQLYRKCTGLQHPRPAGYDQAVLICPRRQGKTKIATLLAVFESVMYQGNGAKNALLIGQDSKSGLRALFKYVEEYVNQVPALSNMVQSQTKESITLTNGVTLVTLPCRPAAARGGASVIAVLDEVSHFISSDSYARDQELYTAVLPTTFDVPGSKVVILSSPYSQQGLLWNMYTQNWGQDSDILVWKAGRNDMHQLPDKKLDAMVAADAFGSQAEVYGEFLAGLTTLLDPSAVDQCIGEHLEIPPTSDVSYSAGVDVSGGRKDEFVISIGHQDKGQNIIDVVRAWTPPFNPESVVEEAAKVLKKYKCLTAHSDAYSAEWAKQQFSKQGVTLVQDLPAKAIMYLDSLLPAINSGAVVLPNDQETLRQARTLERRPGKNRDIVDHPKYGGRDDRINAITAVIHMLATKQEEHELAWEWINI